MVKENILERYLRALLQGDRLACRAVIEETLQSGLTANSVYTDVIWPIMLEIDKLYRADRINSAAEALATRINRTIVDQLQNKLPRKPKKDRKITICSSIRDQRELGAQIIADLFESDGWTVRFLGGSVNNDDIMEFIHSFRPDVLLIHGIDANRAPDVRRLIDSIKNVNAFPYMKIMLSGGIFDRAEGLWEEIGADLYAPNASEAVRIASLEEEMIEQPTRTINTRKKRTNQNEKLEDAIA
jgi:methanogenic corrinoid protein MtbC1